LIILGVLLTLLGYILLIPILETVGIILLVIGVALLLLGSTGSPVGGRRYWW
jgi:hypothetical protein